MTRLALLLCLIASPSLAGGLADTATAPDPCAPIATDGMTDEMLRGWRAMLAMKADECGPPSVLLPHFTDREKLEWAFNGSRIPVAPVSVPSSLALMFAALGVLAAIRRR